MFSNIINLFPFLRPVNSKSDSLSDDVKLALDAGYYTLRFCRLTFNLLLVHLSDPKNFALAGFDLFLNHTDYDPNMVGNLPTVRFFNLNFST